MKRTWRALTGPLIENDIPTEALIAHVIRQTIGTPRIASSANVTLIAQSVLTIRRRLIG